MDWEEILKAIYAYIKTWTTTDIVFPGQAEKPSTESWLEVHDLDMGNDFVRKTNLKRGELLMQIGIFTTSKNVYVVAGLVKALDDFLGQ